MAVTETVADEQVNEIPVSSILPNRNQPRTKFQDESLAELADSIREHGIIQPIVVRPLEDGQYEIIAGERRYRAAIIAKLTQVPVVVRTVSTQSSLEMALIENIQREDISAIECARAYKELMDSYGLKQEQVAQKVGKSRAAVANALRLLKLPGDIQDAIEAGVISEGHARALLGLESPVHQLALFKKIVEIGLSVRDVERIVSGKVEPKPEPPAPVSKDPNWVNLEESLSKYLGSRALIQRSKRGGKIVIEYYSEDELQGILDHIGLQP